MKQLLTLLFMIISFQVIVIAQPKNKPDTAQNKICQERGHVLTGPIIRSSASCPEYILDTDSTTVLIRPNCNSSWTECMRCGKIIGFNGTETRKIIWKVKPKTQNK